MLQRLAIAAALLLIAIPGHGQNGDQPAEVTALFDDISDIDHLRVLNPLELTAAQIGKILPAIQKSQKAYTAAVQDAAVAPIKAIASEIRSTRARVVAGATIPRDFDDKVKKLQSEFVARRSTEENTTLRKLSAEIRAILTPEQIAAAVKIARKDGSREGTDAQFFNYYVMSTFIVYPRIVPLLQDVQKAKGVAAATGSVQRLAGR